MIEIGRLCLQLPAGFERRGEPIARLVGQALAHQPVTAGRRIESLQVGPLRVDPGQSNTQVARLIARSISRQFTSGGV